MSTNTENKDLIILLKNCAKDKREAQKELYKLFYAYAMSVCIRYANDREDAVEIMNDGYMKVFTYIKKFDFEKPFKPWFRKILINCAIDKLKKVNKHNGMVDLDSLADNQSAGIPQDAITYNEMLAIVTELPPAYRMVFNLIAIEGYKHEEVAQQLGISVGTSKSNYFKAKQKLKEQMKLFFEVGK